MNEGLKGLNDAMSSRKIRNGKPTHLSHQEGPGEGACGLREETEEKFGPRNNTTMK